MKYLKSVILIHSKEKCGFFLKYIGNEINAPKCRSKFHNELKKADAVPHSPSNRKSQGSGREGGGFMYPTLIQIFLL